MDKFIRGQTIWLVHDSGKVYSVKTCGYSDQILFSFNDYDDLCFEQIEPLGFKLHLTDPTVERFNKELKELLK